MKYVFLDTETGGLDVDKQEVVEIAWAVDDGPVKTVVPPHDFAKLDPAAMRVNRYLERELDKKKLPFGSLFAPNSDGVTVRNRGWASYRQELQNDLAGATIVGANPAFDLPFLRKLFRLGPQGKYQDAAVPEVWKYRMIDVEAMYFQAFKGYEACFDDTIEDYVPDRSTEIKTRGLVPIARSLDLEIDEEQTHTAAGDVDLTRQVFWALMFP